VSKHSDAAFKVPLNGHLLAIQQGNTVPSGALAGHGCWKTGIKIGRD
jgi:hypothetical protein